MPFNVYDPCPCGSGKKIKFCCQDIVDEMERIGRLADGNQPRVALQQLEKLNQKFPNRSWVVCTLAILNMESGEDQAALDHLKRFLENEPDNEVAIGLYATTLLKLEGPDRAKKAIYRAFQKTAKKEPRMVSMLAQVLSDYHFDQDHEMAGREHLALALKLAPEEHRQEIFIDLLECDGDSNIAYPLRGTHPLPTIDGLSEDQQKEIRKSQKYSGIGCWGVAADLFQQLSRTITDKPEVWHSLGLCRAWEGNEAAASEALHRAAQLYADEGLAVECETLAQLFDRKRSDNQVEHATIAAFVESVSRLLTILDGSQRFVRISHPSSKERMGPIAAYMLLDRPMPIDVDFSSLTIDLIPKRIGNVLVFDSQTGADGKPTLLVTCESGSPSEEVLALITDLGGSLVEWQMEASELIDQRMVSTQHNWLSRTHVFPRDCPHSVDRRISDEFRQTYIEDWLRTPQWDLAGRSPLDAASDPAQAIAVKAAVYAMEAEYLSHKRYLDINELFSRLNLTHVPERNVDESTPINSLSLMQMHRLPVERLNAEQLKTVVNREMLILHGPFLYRVLKVAVERTDFEFEDFGQRPLAFLANYCAFCGRIDEALGYIELGRRMAPSDNRRFECQLNWDVVELTTRLQQPNNPELNQIINRFVTYYSPKVPQIRPQIEGILRSFGVPSPWNNPGIITVGVESQSTEELWTPGTPTESSAGESKLWLPGQ